MDFEECDWPLPDDIQATLQYADEIKFMSRMAATSTEKGVIHDDGRLEASPAHLAKALGLCLVRLGITHAWVPYSRYREAMDDFQREQRARERGVLEGVRDR